MEAYKTSIDPLKVQEPFKDDAPMLPTLGIEFIEFTMGALIVGFVFFLNRKGENKN